MVGLDVAGIDVVAIDISQPCEPGTGAIVEVNAAPGLRMHLAPSSGQPRPVGEAIIGTLFGVFIMVMIRNGLNLMGVSPFWQGTAIGTIIIAALLAERLVSSKVNP